MKIKEFFILATLLLSVILIVGEIPANAEIIPVIEIEKDTDIFTPSVIGNDSYYIIGSNDLERPYDVCYNGKIITYGDFANGTDGDYTSNPRSLSPNEYLDTSLKTTNRRNRFNPFLDPLGDPLPKLVRFDNPNGTFTAMQQKPLSLHFNHSFTFLAEQGVEYIGLLQSSEPFYLDVGIWESEFNLFGLTDLFGTLRFGNADPAEVPLVSGKNTIPIFPREPTTNFTFWLSGFGKTPTSLVTFTPHLLRTFNIANGYEYVDFEGINKTAIPVNSTYLGNIVQGNFENMTAEGYIEPSASDIFSVRYFTLPIVQDSEYRIFVDISFQDLPFGLVSIGTYFPFLISGDMANPYYEEISGFLTSGGLRIKALETTDLVLALYSKGIIRADYSIFFNQVSPTPENIEPLTLNSPVWLLENVMYEFTLAQDVMMAINYSTVDHDIEFYKLSDGEWESVINTDSTIDSFLEHIAGDVYTNVTGSLDWRWFYIPAGTYAVNSLTSPGIDDFFQFNTITVQELSSGSTTLSVSENSFFALQLPVTYHRYNNFSLSTTDHINQSVTYDYIITGKYHEIIQPTTDSEAMGNAQISGIWQAWNENDTHLYAITPARTNEIPILVLRPVQATQNVSDPTDLVDTFIANLTITNTVPANFYPVVDVNGFDAYGFSGGAFIPLSTPVTDTSQFAINDDYSTLFNHQYSIPLTVDAESVYNVTAYLVGNYTSGGAKNATFQGLTVTSGNMGSLEVFNSGVPNDNDTHTWITLWVLTLSGSDHYLYVDIFRDFFPVLNATMIITLTKVPINKMSFNIPETYTWSATIHSNELSDNVTLLAEIPAEYVVFPAPGFEVLFVLGGLVITAAIILKHRQKKRVPKSIERSG